jgi:hypothetical protein
VVSLVLVFVLVLEQGSAEEPGRVLQEDSVQVSGVQAEVLEDLLGMLVETFSVGFWEDVEEVWEEPVDLVVLVVEM